MILVEKQAQIGALNDNHYVVLTHKYKGNLDKSCQYWQAQTIIWYVLINSLGYAWLSY